MSNDELLDTSFKLDGIDFDSSVHDNGGGPSTPLPYTTSDSNLTLRNDDLSLRFISEFFDLDRPLPQQQQDRQQSSVSGTAFSSEPPREWRQINASDAHKRAQIESLHVIDSTEGFDRVWTILNVDCVPLSKNGKVSTATSEQTLGDLIHSIFSGCNLGLTSSLPSFPFESFADIGDVLSARAAKIPRDAKETLFSSLVGACTLPISVCRLLSDLQEDNRKEAASPPISSTGDNSPRMPALSVEDVIQDLQHMSFHPEIYLYDPGTEFYSTKLLFGQRLYGRKDELTQLLGISTKLESASTGGKAECVIVSGGAGSGKTHFVYNVSAFLSNIGWVVTSASCNRGMANRSTETVLSLFDMMVTNLLAYHDSDSERGSTRVRCWARLIRRR